MNSCHIISSLPMLAMLGLASAMFPHPLQAASCETPQTGEASCTQLEPLTIFGSAPDSQSVAGGAQTISQDELQAFETTDVARALRRAPGVSLQLEDGWGLRPNISIRGTASERSSRITLMEDNILIAPAPYAAPSAYYFPTFGRIHSLEVLKGPASITQGPYTVGGAVNLMTTPIPERDRGVIQAEYGSDSTWRAHGWYGGGNDHFGYLVETHQWQSDGYQQIDASDSNTGLDKQDYLAKLAFNSDPSAEIFQRFEIKLQSSEEDSQQSYLGLTDGDFETDPLRRYRASSLDTMHNEHQQAVLTWRLENQQGSGLTVSAYNNEFERAWYKTEGLDFDGSTSPESFQNTGWASIIDAINQGSSLGGVDAAGLQAIVNGADTPYGSIQVKNNAREYFSRGIQLVADHDLQTGGVLHQLQAGLRYHEDEEDRLQRADTYQQQAGELVLNQRGLEGNAGNQLQDAKAWAVYLQDRMEFGPWTLSPGLRYENIKLSRTRYLTNSDDPSSRAAANFRDTRENHLDVWLPGIGALYQVNAATRLVAGVHRGFAVPGNEPGVDPEKSVNYELGLRHHQGRLALELMAFFNDYQNLVGVCTQSSGSNCEPGDAFNGNGVHVPGLELSARFSAFESHTWQVPLELAYTWMKAEFQSDFDSGFFGEVSAGDPVPYIPDNQLWVSAGLLGGPWALRISASYVESVCTAARCGAYEKTDNSLTVDASAHYAVNPQLTLYAVVENIADDIYLAAREPYGARPNKPRTFMAGARFSF